MLDEVINQVLSTEGLFLGQNQSWKPPSSSSFLKGAQPPWHTSTRFDSWGLLSISLLWLYHAVVQKKRTIHVHHSHYPATTPKAASYLLSVAFSSGCRCCRKRTYVSPLQGGAQCCDLAKNSPRQISKYDEIWLLAPSNPGTGAAHRMWNCGHLGQYSPEEKHPTSPLPGESHAWGLISAKPSENSTTFTALKIEHGTLVV